MEKGNATEKAKAREGKIRQKGKARQGKRAKEGKAGEKGKSKGQGNAEGYAKAREKSKLTNQKNTPAVIQRAMEKHNLGSGSAEHYELVQIISEDKELVIPPKVNVFYTMTTQANLDFTLRRKASSHGGCKGGAWAAQQPPDLQAGGAGGSAESHVVKSQTRPAVVVVWSSAHGEMEPEPLPELRSHN
ncbi:hypothetical protein Q9233_015851 [Columba guinea]|nr:hypothetical protein Q9233_015851 [Columba guinea]